MTVHRCCQMPVDCNEGARLRTYVLLLQDVSRSRWCMLSSPAACLPHLICCLCRCLMFSLILRLCPQIILPTTSGASSFTRHWHQQMPGWICPFHQRARMLRQLPQNPTYKIAHLWCDLHHPLLMLHKILRLHRCILLPSAFCRHQSDLPAREPLFCGVYSLSSIKALIAEQDFSP